MTPRLTKYGRGSRIGMLKFQEAINRYGPKVAWLNSRPSPAERLRQRRKAWNYSIRISCARNRAIAVKGANHYA